MAITIIPLGIGGNALRIMRDANCNATAENNVNDGAATVYCVRVDNLANAAKEYVKFYNTTPATIGTTDPDMILMITASIVKTFVFKTGTTFGTALSFACVTTAGTAGTTSPVTNPVLVDILVS